MFDLSNNIIRDGGIFVISFVLVARFVLELLEKLGKFPMRGPDPFLSIQNGGSNGYCKYPGKETLSIVMQQIKQMYEDGIRRTEKDEHQIKILEKLAEGMQLHTLMLRNVEKNLTNRSMEME